MEHTVIHDEKVNRFEVFESGQIAYLQYEEKDGGAGYTPYHGSSTIGRNGNSSRFDNGCCQICRNKSIEDKTYLFICKNIFHTSFAIRGFIGIKTKKQCVGNPM